MSSFVFCFLYGEGTHFDVCVIMQFLHNVVNTCLSFSFIAIHMSMKKYCIVILVVIALKGKGI